MAEVYDYSADAGSRLANISVRALVQGGDNVLIGGLIVVGESSAKIVLRALGPSLALFGITNALTDPTLELRDKDGTLVRFNDNWRDSGAQATQITRKRLAPSDSRECGMAVTLAPGNYTAIVRGKNGAVGVGLFEAYNVSP